MRKIKSEGLSEVKKEDHLKFRTFEKFGTLRFHLPSVPVIVLLVLFFSACGANLSDERAIELVRLNYKQQNSIEGAGTWLLDTVIIAETKKLPGDTCILVQANVSGLYKLPVMEDTPAETFERFKDTIQFKACKWGRYGRGMIG
ncbi:MAG: hypothetical protein IPP79_06130 [Chitinophagaceae bacterium]|nr:hypothetical protein [Chitinophagaceae bacterium]